MTMEFEFDSEKDEANWKKHHIRLAVAALVFTDPMRLERLDDGEYGEDRWQTLGRVHDILFVVYTERGSRRRLISARLATKPERRSYHGHYLIDNSGWTKAD